MTDVIELTGEGLATAERERRAATCGTCGRSWDDTISTSRTPVPAGRCPFEEQHADEEEGDTEQYHFVVWAQKRNGKTEWHIDIDTALLDEGSVFDEKRPWGIGWRPVDGQNPADVALDDEFFTDLRNRLGITY